MPKFLTLTLIFLSLSALKTRALPIAIGTPHDDSVKKIAVADARKFRLDDARLKIFRWNRLNWSREYLAPGGPGSHAAMRRAGRQRISLGEYKHRQELATGYFDPVASAVTDTALLSDSVYVNTYREEALRRTLHRRSFGHYAWIGGSVVAGATFIALLVYLMSLAYRLR